MSLSTRVFLLLWLALSAPSLTFAETTREEVTSLLKGYEWHVPRERLLRIGPDAWKPLLDIARDSGQPAFIRARAASSLTLYPNDDVWAFYTTGIQGEGPQTVRRRMVDYLCTTFSDARPREVERILEPLLASRDAWLGTRAAACLRKIGSDTALRALDDWRKTMAEPWEEEMIFGGRQAP